MANIIEGNLIGSDLKFGIIAARFNSFITERLVDGSLDILIRHGVDESAIDIVKVPGSFEIFMVAKKMVKAEKYDAIICLGTIIRGATPHFEFVAAEASKGVAAVAMEANIPILFGVLTTDNLEQAIERAGSKAGNKGSETALAALEMVNLFKLMG